MIVVFRVTTLDTSVLFYHANHFTAPNLMDFQVPMKERHIIIFLTDQMNWGFEKRRFNKFC